MSPIFEQHKDITSLTTFGIPASARWYAEYASKEEILKISRSEVFINNEVLNIGSGSNLLFVGEYNGLVLRSRITDIKSYSKDADTIYVISGAGVDWDEFVDWCIDHGYGGVENMAGIPGTVGASAVQNVGAYGVEAKDVIYRVECFDTLTRNTRTFTAEECRFGYRDSFFKHEGKERYIVLRVCYRLRQSDIAVNLEYKPVREYAASLGHAPSIREIAAEVRRIRAAKLPDPRVTGSAGSFFKNPVVSKPHYDSLCHRSGCEIPAHVTDDGRMKLSAAWLIDHAGMKGHRYGGAMVWEKQPLVIVNAGNASAHDVLHLVEEIRSAVRRKFFIDLYPEVNYIDTSIEVTLLGSGTSKGVPEVGCECEVCRSEDVRDKRLRASVLVRTHGMNILIDPSPDFRQQALDNKIFDIDAVLVTHIHYDHVGGIDDLRPFCLTGDIPLYTRHDVAVELRKKLDYCFRDHHYPGVPTFDMHEVDNFPFYINGLKIEPVEVLHGSKPIYGYRIGRFAYITDAKSISETEKEKLHGLDTLIVNGLRYEEHFAHFTIPEALGLIDELKPRQAFLTHMNHEAGLHAWLDDQLPPNVHPCYDGLKIKV
mgnify:CR=1 FL=1